jgi:hypothetical protein
MSAEDNINPGAQAAAAIAHATVIVDSCMVSWVANESQVKIRAGEVEYEGRLLGFDRKRLTIMDESNRAIIIYLESGVVLIGPPEEEVGFGKTDIRN